MSLFQMFQHVPMKFRALEQVFYFLNQLVRRFCSIVPMKFGFYVYVCACVRVRVRAHTCV
jgi:hypothetical protein